MNSLKHVIKSIWWNCWNNFVPTVLVISVRLFLLCVQIVNSRWCDDLKWLPKGPICNTSLFQPHELRCRQISLNILQLANMLRYVLKCINEVLCWSNWKTSYDMIKKQPFQALSPSQSMMIIWRGEKWNMISCRWKIPSYKLISTSMWDSIPIHSVAN